MQAPVDVLGNIPEQNPNVIMNLGDAVTLPASNQTTILDAIISGINDGMLTRTDNNNGTTVVAGEGNSVVVDTVALDNGLNATNSTVVDSTNNNVADSTVDKNSGDKTTEVDVDDSNAGTDVVLSGSDTNTNDTLPITSSTNTTQVDVVNLSLIHISEPTRPY